MLAFFLEDKSYVSFLFLHTVHSVMNYMYAALSSSECIDVDVFLLVVGSENKNLFSLVSSKYCMGNACCFLF